MNPKKGIEEEGKKIQGDFKPSVKLKAWERRKVIQLKVKRIPKPDMK